LRFVESPGEEFLFGFTAGTGSAIFGKPDRFSWGDLPVKGQPGY
jgi:hypothetical protein